MNVLVVGSGGREHALAWKLRREGMRVIVAPGNGGTPGAVDVAATDIHALVALARRERAELTIVGPEAPLAVGLVDTFEQAGLAVLGPSRAAARLEWSKAWAKAFLLRHGIPTPTAEVVSTEAQARRAIGAIGLPVVLKADGLAAGKGVFVTHTREDLELALEQLFRAQTFGAAAEQVLIEEFCEGPELSILALSDGQRLAVMPPVRDYKRLGQGDIGPNTGGMGGLTWPAHATPDVLDRVTREVLRPTLAGMAAEGNAYRGVLYAGLMLSQDGPIVLEFNCRFGDPECQLILPLLESSLAEACAAAAAGELEPRALRWAERRTYGVVLAAPGYPEAPRLGEPIGGLDEIPREVNVFHAGTRRSGLDDQLVTAGGRVLTLVGSDRAAVYSAAEKVRFAGKQFRRDIGLERVAAGVPA